jgi:hypothetical protein
VKYQVLVRRLAERDLEEAEDWYDEQQFGLGIESRNAISDLLQPRRQSEDLSASPW